MTSDTPTTGPGIEALMPSGEREIPSWTPLATTDPTVSPQSIVLLDSMPGGGSGMASAIDLFAQRLRQVWPAADVVRTTRTGSVFGDGSEQAAHLAETSSAVVYFAPPMGSLTFTAARFARELESRGTPCLLVAYTTFRPLIDDARPRLGMDLRCVFVPNPLPSDVSRLAEVATEAVERLSTSPSPEAQRRVTHPDAADSSDRLAGRAVQLQRQFADRGWTDGLPVTLPTPDVVEWVLSGTSRDPQDVVVASLPPADNTLRVKTVAVNAAMAGAKPEHLPVILTAVSMFGHRRFESMTKSVNSFVFPVLVNGPVRTALSLNPGLGALGPGNESAAVIGRAIGLVLQNAGEAWTGITAFPAQGNVAGTRFVVAENEEASPWPSFSERRGFSPDVSTVSLFYGGFSHVGTYHLDPVERMGRAAALFEPPHGVLALLSPKRATTLADEGLSAQDVERLIQKSAEVPAAEARSSGFWPTQLAGAEDPERSRLEAIAAAPADRLIRVFADDTVHVAVVGGDVAAVMQAWSLGYHDTKPVGEWA